MASITAIILTKNEEGFISKCIDSIKSIVKRIVIVDSFSDDNTVGLARQYGAEVFQHPFFNYSKQYQYAVDVAKINTTWVLRIDADEWLTKESSAEIESLCNGNEKTNVNGIILRFCNNFMGKDLKHGAFYPWRKLSIYKNGKGFIEQRNMDEHIVLLDGTTIKARKDSKHMCFRGLSFFTDKCNWYSTREAMDYFDNLKTNKRNAEKKTRIKMAFYYKLPSGFRSWCFYVYCFYFRLGFLDGKEGKIFCFLQSYWYRFLVDAKIYEHKKMGYKFEPSGDLKSNNGRGNHD